MRYKKSAPRAGCWPDADRETVEEWREKRPCGCRDCPRMTLGLADRTAALVRMAKGLDSLRPRRDCNALAGWYVQVIVEESTRPGWRRVHDGGATPEAVGGVVKGEAADSLHLGDSCVALQ